jgi:hypothetical protein
MLHIGNRLPNLRDVKNECTNRKKRNAYRILVGKPEGRRPLGRPIRTWVGTNKIDFRKIRWVCMD